MTTEALAVVEGPAEATSAPSAPTAGADLSLSSPPPPEVTALSDAGASSSALPTEISTTIIEPSNGLVEAPSVAPTGGLGEPPAAPADTGVSIGSAAQTSAPQGMDPVAERAMISVGSIGEYSRLISLSDWG